PYHALAQLAGRVADAVDRLENFVVLESRQVRERLLRRVTHEEEHGDAENREQRGQPADRAGGSRHRTSVQKAVRSSQCVSALRTELVDQLYLRVAAGTS